jgi:hypothetical protein
MKQRVSDYRNSKTNVEVAVLLNSGPRTSRTEHRTGSFSAIGITYKNETSWGGLFVTVLKHVAPARRFIGAMCLMTVMIGLVRADVGDADVGGLFQRDDSAPSGSGRSEYRLDALAALPLNRLIPHAQQQVTAITNSPTLYRRLPTQAITSDPDMFLFLARNPDVLVGMWDLMGITDVKIQRTGPFQLRATDGAGTTCVIDLIYGDANLHVFVANGSYDGKLVTKAVTGKGVFLLRSGYAQSATGQTTVTGTLDCFLQFDSLGADLIVRTLGGLIGRSADHNFRETAGFMSQVSQASQANPDAMTDVARRLPQVDEPIKVQFAGLIDEVGRR